MSHNNRPVFIEKQSFRKEQKSAISHFWKFIKKWRFRFQNFERFVRRLNADQREWGRGVKNCLIAEDIFSTKKNAHNEKKMLTLDSFFIIQMQ